MPDLRKEQLNECKKAFFRFAKGRGKNKELKASDLYSALSVLGQNADTEELWTRAHTKKPVSFEEFCQIDAQLKEMTRNKVKEEKSFTMYTSRKPPRVRSGKSDPCCTVC